MGGREDRTAFEWALGVIVLALILVAIECAVRAGWINGIIVPAPSRIIGRSLQLIGTSAVFLPLATTLYLVFAAYVLACTLAIVVGVVMGRVPFVYNTLEPLLESLRPIPKAALVPLLMMALGLGETMKLTVVGLAVFFPVLINTIQGVQGVDPILVGTAKTFGHGRFATLFKVVLPASSPLIATGMRVSLALALILAVVTEMITGAQGLGYLIVDMQRSFKILDMYAWLTILAIVGYLLNALFVLLERRLLHWVASN